MGGALRESAVWVACGLAFAGVVAVGFGGQAFGEYISGYLIEKSLSVDNVFVWAILFTTMAIPLKYQHRVLFWGIFGALALRVVFILVGSALIGRFCWLLVVFGVFLVYTGMKSSGTGLTKAASKTPGLGMLERCHAGDDELRRTSVLHRAERREGRDASFAALVVVEVTDVIFAVDSVPAVLAVSHEPFIVFASNAFAILGLRAMYFLLAGAKEKFRYLATRSGGSWSSSA